MTNKHKNAGGKLHYAFIVAIACSGLSLLMSLVLNILGIFYLPITTEFGISMTTMSFCIVLFSLSYTVAMLVINRAINKFDTRLVLLFSVLGLAVSFGVRAVSNNIIGFYITAVIQGICWIIICNLMGPFIANNWFNKHTVTVIALISVFTNLGGFIFNALGGWIIQYYGWRVCFWVWMGIDLLIGVPLALLVRKSPEEIGLQPYGVKEEADSKPFKKIGLDAKSVLKTPAFWLIGIALGLDGFGDTYSSYISPYAQMLGATAIVGGLMASLVNFGGIGGKLILGPICDKHPKGGGYLTNVCGALGFVGIIIMGKTGFSFGLYAAMCILYGVAYSASAIGFSSFTRSAFGPKDFGKIWPTLNMFLGIIGAVGAMAFGLVVDFLGYEAGPYIVSAVYSLAFICLLFASKNSNKYRSQWTEEQ